MRDNKSAHPRTHDEAKVVEKIMTEARQLLKDYSTPVFLVNNYEPAKYDFRKLEESLVVNFPKLKRSALIFSLSAFSSEIVKLKVKVLRSRLWKMSLLSGGVATTPVPGLSIVFDTGLVLHEANFYKTQLGLDEQSLQKLADYTATDVELLKQIAAKMSITLTAEGIKKIALAVTGVATLSVAEEICRLIPFIGPVMAAPLSFSATYLTMKYILKQFEETALEVLRVAFS